jgi:hypothetical protein
MTIPEYVPTFDALGVPFIDPVALLKLSHPGRLAILNVRLSPSGSDAVGVKL